MTKIKFNLDNFKKNLLLIILIFANITGLIAMLLGSAFAEGCIIVFTILLMSVCILNKKRYDILDIASIFVILYSILLTLIMISFFDIEQSALIGIYYYSLPCTIFLNRDNKFFKKNIDFYFYVFLFFIILNSLWAIYQTINPNCLYPVQSGTFRVRGLMKSTLNYSGLLGASFFPILFFRFKPKFLRILSILILLIGSFLTVSKGFFTNIITGVICSYPVQLLTGKIQKKQLYNIIQYLLIGTIVLTIAIIIIIQTNTVEKYEQFINFLNFVTNKSNAGRADAWFTIFDYFPSNPFGYGVGQLHSGTDFVVHSVGFESYILGTFYSIGFVALIYFALPILYYIQNFNNLSSKYSQFYLMYLIGVYIQNLVQCSMLTPTTAVITWFNFIFLMNYFKQKTIDENKQKIKS